MIIKQLSIFVENKAGRMAEVTEILANNNIDIRALSIADTTDYGILRLIVNNPQKALDALKAASITDQHRIHVCIFKSEQCNSLCYFAGRGQ